MAGQARTVKENLVGISRLSLMELASLDDFTVTGTLGELLGRHRCGVGPAGRYSAQKDGGGGGGGSLSATSDQAAEPRP